MNLRNDGNMAIILVPKQYESVYNLTSLTPALFVLDVYMYVCVSMSVVTP